MSGNYSVSLAGPAPWGFRLQGGKDFNTPLSISRLIEGGKAAQANIGVGDLVLSIDGIATEGMNHLEAQNKIKACTGNLNLTMQKASSVPKVTEVVKDQLPEIIKPVPITQLAPPTAPAVSISPSPAYNKTARPFGAVSAPTITPKVASIPSASSAFTPAAPPPQPPFPLASSKSSPSRPSQGVAAFPSSSPSSSSSSSSSPSRVTAAPPPSTAPAAPHSSVYNTPINLYSNENACEVAMGQRRGLLESQGGAVQQNGGPEVVQKKPLPPRAPRKPIVETDIHFYHIPSHGNASKKRLIQDTEDWHPHTGLSQSRSFRILAQMTGTEEGSSDLGEGDAGKKAPKVNPQIIGPRYATLRDWHHGVSARTLNVIDSTEEPGAQVAKTMTKAPVSTVRNAQGGVHAKPGAQVRHVTPSFGSVTNSSSKVPAPERPAPRPHPKDEDSLVQRAEHKPASARTPMCAHCNQVIRGPFLVAMGKSWHPEEFNCAHCRTSLAHVGFVEESGTVYCEHCYEEFLAPTCGRCQHKILGEVINALKQTWHVSCFLCASCQQPIGNSTFHLEDGEPYCDRDYYSLFGTSCLGCDFPIEAGDKFLEALGGTWHDTCFVCTVCCTSLEGQAFFSKNGKPLCKKHAHTVKI